MKEMPKELQAFCVEPSSSEYDNLRSSCGQEGHPAVIFTPSTNEQVAAVLAYVNALRQDGDECAFSVMSGGHGITKASTNQGGIVLNLSKMSDITILDEEKALVRVGAGCRWGQVAQTLAPHDWIITSGYNRF